MDMFSSDSDSNSDDDGNKNVNPGLFLPEELLVYIFTLLPLNCLFNSVRYVSKPWAAIIASSHFVEACRLCNADSKPGIYVENPKYKTSSYFLEFKDSLNGQFERTDLGTPKKMGRIIGTCHGILLLFSKARQLFVANPILKCWLRIPRFPTSPSKLGLPLLCQCTITRVPRTSVFKLFNADVHGVSGACWYVFYVLRIGIDESWKEIARKEASQPTFPLYFSWEPLYSGGNDLYWITNEEVILMDVDREIIVREYPLPPITTYSSPYSIFLRMGDRISRVVTIDSTSTHQIYLLDFDSGEWSLYHEMGPFDYKVACGLNLNTTYMMFYMMFCLWINDQIIFRVGQLKKNIHFCYNVKTKQLTKFGDIDVGDFEVWLHTNSLVSLPTPPA